MNELFVVDFFSIQNLRVLFTRISIYPSIFVSQVKYLGSEHARGLWGIKHTRRPVDHLVTIAKTLPPNKILPLCNLTISLDGVFIETSVPTSGTTKKWEYTIDTISYGVQDLVYTRVFAMIVVKENYNIKDPNPFEVHAFVCDSR